MSDTTLNKIRMHAPCALGWAKLLKHLGKTQADDELLALATILDSNGLDDAVWCLRAVDGHDREKRLFAVACARRMQHLMTDQRSIAALDVAERYANGQATEKELTTARDAAWDAADAAGAAWAARAAARTARDAALAAAWAAAEAARAAAWAVARVAARAVAEAAGAVARIARNAALAAAWAAAEAARAAAWDAEADWQTAEFRRVFCGGEA